MTFNLTANTIGTAQVQGLANVLAESGHFATTINPMANNQYQNGFRMMTQPSAQAPIVAAQVPAPDHLGAVQGLFAMTIKMLPRKNSPLPIVMWRLELLPIRHLHKNMVITRRPLGLLLMLPMVS